MATDIDQRKKDRKDQKIVLTNILCACVLLFCFGVIAAYYPFPKPHLPTLLDRLVFTLRWLIVSLSTVFAGIIWVANTRFRTSAINPLNRSGTKYVEIRSRYLQNTVEQFLLHSVSLHVRLVHLSFWREHGIGTSACCFVLHRSASLRSRLLHWSSQESSWVCHDILPNYFGHYILFVLPVCVRIWSLSLNLTCVYDAPSPVDRNNLIVKFLPALKTVFTRGKYL